jgi:hypothetical protein
MTDSYYEMKFPDQQADVYKYILSAWVGPTRMSYAVDSVIVTEHCVTGYDSEGTVITVFSVHMPFILTPRDRVDVISDEAAFERSLEYAQAQKMRMERSAAILGPKEKHDERYL